MAGGLTKGKSNRHSKLKSKYAAHFLKLEAKRKRAAAARKRKAQSPGALRRKAVREAKHALSLMQAPARIAVRLAQKVASNA